MENINIKVILDEVLVNLVIVLLVIPVNIKKIANLLINSLMILKIKVYLQTNMLQVQLYFVYVLKEQKYINDFGKTQEDIIKLATENGFELDWLINRWDSIIEDKDILKPILAVFPKYAKDMIINIVNANTEINHLIAQHIIDTSNAEYKEMIKMVNQSVDNNK